MDDEESHRMAQFAAFIDNEQVNNSGLARELGDTRARLAAARSVADKVLAVLEHIVMDTDEDRALHARVIDTFRGSFAAALGATDQAGGER